MQMKSGSIGRVATFSMLLATGLNALLTGCAQLLPAPTPLEKLSTQAMQPSFSRWQQQTQQLQYQLQQFCTGGARQTQVQEAWKQAAIAWGQLQPMLLDNANETSVRVSYWPDKKNLVALQAEAALKNPAPGVAELEQGSVAMQGLSALEYLLFDTKYASLSVPQQQQICPLLQNIGERQVKLAQQTLERFSKSGGTAQQLSKLPNERFADAQDALTELLKAQVNALELAEKKLVVAIGSSAPQPYQAEFWRSGSSLNSTLAVLQGSQALWQQGFHDLIAAKDSELALSIDQMYEALLSQLSTNSAPLSALLQTPAGIQQARALAGQLKVLHLLYARDASQALGIQLGFNANDGD